ncbi:CobQ/CobB/MinD/ParA nucleotide binding domain protein [Aliarcobacter thereius]|uniref:ParA family protein n=1 Tax=Aliarcobacter thereius TaxID=544718 RepID=UPI000829000A|nr:ParA family protein [Aliarcobacter thereius]OCL83710.1 CobQ/CobB/MinD/ParA nucleotide binding domain protein [Aliarcobacter thereius]OCL85709.1 CobQ/CobB/MinD/ParA nucleotide binding domain protein [Aliarcobacter thereius]
MIITVAHTKGGVGKSTLAWNLAHSLLEKNEKVTIVDLDFQQTLFFINSLNENPKLEVLQPQDASELLEIFENYQGYLIVDVGGFDSDINRIAMNKANKILVPISESVTEIIGFRTFEAIIDEVETSSITMILNNIHPLQKDFTSVENAIQNNNSKLLKTIIRQRKTYKTVLADGKSVFESKDIKAIEEIRGLRDELIK